MVLSKQDAALSKGASDSMGISESDDSGIEVYRHFWYCTEWRNGPAALSATPELRWR